MKGKELDGVMSLGAQARGILLTEVTKGSTPRYTVTQPGDPARQAVLKATLPNIYTARKINEDREDISSSGMAVGRSLYEFLFDHEMSLGMGG